MEAGTEFQHPESETGEEPFWAAAVSTLDTYILFKSLWYV